MTRRRSWRSSSVPWNAPHWRLVMMMSFSPRSDLGHELRPVRRELEIRLDVRFSFQRVGTVLREVNVDQDHG
jgi:hypothetical protein